MENNNFEIRTYSVSENLMRVIHFLYAYRMPFFYNGEKVIFECSEEWIDKMVLSDHLLRKEMFVVK